MIRITKNIVVIAIYFTVLGFGTFSYGQFCKDRAQGDGIKWNLTPTYSFDDWLAYSGFAIQWDLSYPVSPVTIHELDIDISESVLNNYVYDSKIPPTIIPYFSASINGTPVALSICSRQELAIAECLWGRFDKGLLHNGNNEIALVFNGPNIIAEIDYKYCYTPKIRTPIPFRHKVELRHPKDKDNTIAKQIYSEAKTGAFTYNGTFFFQIYDPLEEFGKALDELLSEFDRRLEQYKQLLPAQQERYRNYNARLEQFVKDISELFSKDLLEITPDAIAELISELGIDPQFDLALQKVITDFLSTAQKTISELRDLVQGQVTDTTQKMEEMVNRIAQNVLGDGFSLEALNNYQPVVPQVEVPEVSIPEITPETGKPYTDENNPYLAEANGVIATLLAKTNGAVVVDRGGFIDIVLAWRKRQLEYEMMLLGSDVIIQREAEAFRKANDKVRDFIMQFMDENGWFRDHIAPADARHFLDMLSDPASDASPAIHELAGRLKLAVDKWSPTPCPEMATFFVLLAGFRDWYDGYKATINSGADPAANAEIEASTESLLLSLIDTAFNIGVSQIPYVGDAIDLCEIVTGKERCVPAGKDLSTTERAWSTVGLVAGSAKFWRFVGEKTGSLFKIFSRRAEIVIEETADITAAERKALAKQTRRYLQKETIEWLEGACLGVRSTPDNSRCGKALKWMMDEFGHTELEELCQLSKFREGVWKLNPFTRGTAIEMALGNRLKTEGWTILDDLVPGKNFPLFDFRKGNIFSSLKSVDTGTTAWASRMQKVMEKIENEYMEAIKKVGDGTNPGTAILVLEVRIQPGGIAGAKDLLERLVKFGQGRQPPITFNYSEF